MIIVLRRASLLLLTATLLTLMCTSPLTAKPLIINEAQRSVEAVIVEAPEAEGRAEVLKYAEAIRDMFFKGVEVVDATKLDDAQLKQKIKGSFVLYTTLSQRSRLLNAASAPLPMKLDGETLRWGEFAVSAREARVVTVGKNPYGDGFCVIYAAGTNHLLFDINKVHHGPCSYHVFRGDTLLKEGFFDDQFADASSVSKAQALEDAEQFFSTLQRVHPDLLAKMQVYDYLQLRQRTFDDVAAKADPKGQVAGADLAYVLSYAAARFRDGHTNVQWNYSVTGEGADVRFPSFLMACENGKFTIKKAVDKSIEGMEVLHVDGKSMREFLSPIFDRCSGETPAFIAARFVGKQSFWYGFTKLLGPASSLRLGMRNGAGKESVSSVSTIGASEFAELEAGSKKPVGKGTRVEFVDLSQTAILTYRSFSLSEDEKKKIDKAFSEIKARKSKNLVIDIRGNGGGNSAMGDFIFSYLYDKPFQSFSKVRVKLSKEILTSPTGKGWKIPDNVGAEGMIITWSGEEKAIPKPNAFFSGRVFLLVDNRTLSAATSFAALLRDYEVGKSLGYETGGVPCAFGDVYNFNLKNSNIMCGVSYKEFFCSKPRPGDNEHGVIPDIPISEDILKPYASQDDPVLAFALDHVRKQGE